MSVVSIKRGKYCRLPKTVFRNIGFFFCIEDPFETHDSHMPHDLASPVNERGARRMLQCLRQTEEHLRTVLLKAYDCYDVGVVDVLPTIASLWPPLPIRSKNTSARKATTPVNNANNDRPVVGIDENKRRGKHQQPPKPALEDGISASEPTS